MPDDGGPYRLIHTTIISAVTTVRVYDETLPHIEEFQLELPSFLIQIENTLTAPTHVFADKAGRASYIFVSDRDTYHGNPLHLPVQVVSGTSARLTTGYFTETIYGGQLVWGGTNE